MPVSKLYVEGLTDLRVLKATLSLLPNNPQIAQKGCKDDLPHIVRRERNESPGTEVVYLRDRDFDFEPTFPTPLQPTEIRSGGVVHGYRWQRHEIESYLLTPALVEEVFGVPTTDTESALLAAATAIKDYQAARWAMGQTRQQCRQVGRIQTRPLGVSDFQLPGDLSATGVQNWINQRTQTLLTGYSTELAAVSIAQRFVHYQAKFANLSPQDILVWFSPKDLLAAMDAWRNLPRIRSPQPSDFVAKTIRWIEQGHGLRFFDVIPEAKALADKLTA